MRTRALLIATAALLVGGSSAMATQNIFGVDWELGFLYDVDPVTGAASNARDTGLKNLTGITEGDDGFFYTIQAGVSSELYKINPISGASTFVGATNKEFVTEGDIDFDPTDGTLYAIQETVGNSRGLFTVNPNDGTTVEIGNITEDGGDLSAMAFDDTGQLWVLDTAGTSDRLLKVDKSDGSILDEALLSIALGSVAGMDFDADTGDLFVADGLANGTDKLYTLDISGLRGGAGTLTEIGDLNLDDGLSGLELSAIPEPATLALLAMGGIALIRRRR